MKPLSGLFKPIPFLIRYPVYYEKYYPDEMYMLQLRPFSIMEDISIIYNWINKPRLLSTGHVKPYQRNMLKYYKSILDSSDSQSFMILREAKAVCQFDIFPASTDDLHSRMSASMHDISIRYVADFRIAPSLFSSALHSCLEYIFTFSEDPEVFVSLLPSGILNEKDITAVGFRFIKGLFHQQELVKVFSCKRDELIVV
ncbi:MAG: GNAT family N-acetyltransferase [Chitinophagaceae bacterium]|nr:GNAT family N-acetyltransferase [Chitinophagaceae bacterium]